MTEDTLLRFDLPAVSRKKVTADFAGGSISSDGGLVLLRAAERGLRLAETLAGCIREWRDPARTGHSLPAMLRFRMFVIACGYEDADDCDDLRADPLFKPAARGGVPHDPEPVQPSTPSSKTPNPGTVTAPNTGPARSKLIDLIDLTVESGTGAPAVGSGGCSVAFALGLSPAPTAAFSVPRSTNPACRFPALGSPVGTCASHTGHWDEVATGPVTRRAWSLHSGRPASPIVAGTPPSLFTPRRHRTDRARPLRFCM